MLTCLADWRKKVKPQPIVQLEGIEKDKFWGFYKAKGFSYPQFETLCENFDNHTGLLALAYNDVEAIYQNKLIEAWYDPTLTTRLLWELVERIIDRLEKREAWILCALTFLQNPVKKENLYEDFLTLPDFEDGLQIGDSFQSLANKLLVQLEKGLYDLNPYIREVCYTFLKDRRRLQMQVIKNLPYFKENGKIPFYDGIRQAEERGDYMFLFDLGRKLSRNSDFAKALKAFNAGLNIDPKKENVLNEIGIIYRLQKKFDEVCETLKEAINLGNIHSYVELAICYRDDNQLDEAIKTLEKAKKKHPENVKILNELAICYRENKQFDKAVEILKESMGKKENDFKTLNALAICYRENGNYSDSIEIATKAIKLNNYQSYTVLAITYQKMGDIEMAYQVAEKGMQTSGWDKSHLTNKYKELKTLMEEKRKEKESKQINNRAELSNVMEKKIILFLSANPQDSTLRLDQEMREVENQLLRIAKYRDNFTLNKEVATRIVDLQQRLLDEAPDFVHFSGHGSDSGIYLTDNQGNYQLVRGEALANLFNLFSDKVTCVFLNSCYSENQANEINRFIPYVIGMKKAVPDDVAIQFAVSFYQAIASGRDIEFAFDLAKNSVDLYNLSGSDIPVLLKQ